MPDYEQITINNLMSQLTDIAHTLSTLQSDVAVIKSEQANIKSDLADHKAQTPDKGGLGKAMDVIKQWIFPIVLAIFLLGRQSIEYTKPVQIYPPKAVISSQVDDTFVANKHKVFDSILIKQIMKGIGGS